ncbi:MAG TPA: endonuclease III [Planctomycetaceae bacterium]|nr:endonuclease III [Planctomycetaceae bacterium]
MVRKAPTHRNTPKLPRETPEDRKRRVKSVLNALAKAYPAAECALIHNSPFQLLTATILSAQCTDERVNATVPMLFAKYPTPADLAKARQSDVEKIIKPLGFFRSKATSIRGMAQGLIERHGGEIPRDLDSLVALPGVGRKTANVVLGTAFGIPSGVVVDTHVKRISNLLGFTESANPEIIERELCELLPKQEWIMYSHRLIHHGRRICIARRPKCTGCPLLKFCPRVSLSPLGE